MGKSESYHIWLNTAYQLFAEEGPEALNIKSLAKRCGLPRTNFYYHFENKTEIIDKTIELHFETTTVHLNEELNKRLTSFIPDLYEIVYDFKLGFQFAKQLFKNRENARFNEAHKKGIALSADLIIPKFKDYFKMTQPVEDLKDLYFTLVDTWFSRLNFDEYSVNYLCTLALEIWDSIRPLVENDKETVNLSTPLSK